MCDDLSANLSQDLSSACEHIVTDDAGVVRECRGPYDTGGNISARKIQQWFQSWCFASTSDYFATSTTRESSGIPEDTFSVSIVFFRLFFFDLGMFMLLSDQR